MKLGIGIDTGGTYTDAVIYDYDEKVVLASAKSLTTKEDLSLGIISAIKQLPIEQCQKATIVALSTTLATNACVENKGGRAKLVFLGVHPKVVRENGPNYGLPSHDKIYTYECDTRFNGFVGQSIDYKDFLENSHEFLDDAMSIGVVEVYAMNNGATIEKAVKDKLHDLYNVPIVAGHELYTDLNVLGRGASTLLNARLLPIIDNFLVAIKHSLNELEINAPIVIMRSDSTLMSEEFTAMHPVETLLCGPAASVLGGQLLTNEKNSIVVDMGGTTTDIALIKNNVPVTTTDGIRVGKWKTFVKGLLIDTVGLGGDSAIRFNKHRDLELKRTKITPLCVLADKYPSIIERLKTIKEHEAHTHLLHEFFYLVKDINDSNVYTNKEKDFCSALKNGPLSYEEAAAAYGTDIYNFNVKRLETEGIIMRAGITPTDIMHIKGDFSRYNSTASTLAAEFMATCTDTTLEKLCERIYDMVKKKLFVSICTLLLENKDVNFKNNGVDNSVIRLMELAWEQSKNSATFLDPIFKTKATLIGIGAPIHIFLPDIAKAMGTKCSIPKYAGVANALGALAGKVCAVSEIVIRSHLTDSGPDGYNIHTQEKAIHELDFEKAIKIAKKYAKADATNKAKARGAVGSIKVTVQVLKNTATSRDNTEIFLDTKVVATAM